MPEPKKQVIDPWVKQLVDGYTKAGISLTQEPASADVGGAPAEGMRMKFLLDGQDGTAEAYWAAERQTPAASVFHPAR